MEASNWTTDNQWLSEHGTPATCSRFIGHELHLLHFSGGNQDAELPAGTRFGPRKWQLGLGTESPSQDEGPVEAKRRGDSEDAGAKVREPQHTTAIQTIAGFVFQQIQLKRICSTESFSFSQLNQKVALGGLADMWGLLQAVVEICQ